MWTHLDPLVSTLEQVFAPLQSKAAQFDRPWSIAELKLPNDEVEWLRLWFSHLHPTSLGQWLRSMMPAIFDGDHCVTYRQMIGSLLICAGAEICRESSREDSVWPSIRSLLPDSTALRGDVFLLDGQPSSLTKDVIADSVRILNLRHAMDIEGAQQWYVTIKLQFGFTYRGAKNRLAEWLVNLGRPHAVEYLTGNSVYPELRSESFESLWTALIRYRAGSIGEPEVRISLEGNPWIRGAWIDDLLRQARERIATLGAGEWHAGATDIRETDALDVAEEAFSPIASIGLVWPTGQSPRIRIQLDRQSIEDEFCGASASELDFCIDGRKLRRWPRQPDGSWGGEDWIFAEPDSERVRPNLSPKLLSILSGKGETLSEWDLSDSGLSAEVLTFDLDRESLVKASEERLNRNRHYAIICDRACSLQGGIPIETFERNSISRKALRMQVPLEENLYISFHEFLLWHSVQVAAPQVQPVSLTLCTPGFRIFCLNEPTQLIVEGLPDGVESAELLVHTTTHSVHCRNGIWFTDHEIALTPELAARQRRLRIRFSSGGRTRTVEPRLAFRILGAAMLRYKQEGEGESISLVALPNQSAVNRSEDTTYIRIWVPDQSQGASLFESDLLIGRLRNSQLRLRDIPGIGGALRVMSGEESYKLGIRCRDGGCVSGFIPAMLNNPAQLSLSSEKEHQEFSNLGYSIWIWVERQNGRARLSRVEGSLQNGSTNRTWKFQCDARPMAVALAWKGSWIGAWWRLESIGAYLQNRLELSEQEFAVLKWLRLPVLDPLVAVAFSRLVVHSPVRFFKAWRNDVGIPVGIVPHGHVSGLDAIVRHFMWNDLPQAHAADVASVLGVCTGPVDDPRYLEHLSQLAEISHVLLWKGIERCQTLLPPIAVRSLLAAFSCAQLGLPPVASEDQIRSWLQGLERRVLQAVHLREERLLEIVVECFRCKEEGHWQLTEHCRDDLLRLGQTHSGRRYLAARMCQHWLDQQFA